MWWSWVNLTFTVNVQEGLSRRALAGYMLAAMTAVGVMAVAAPEADRRPRAWLFALGNAMLRIVLLSLWVRRSWNMGTASRVRVLAYNGATAMIWLVSIVHAVALSRFALWAIGDRDRDRAAGGLGARSVAAHRRDQRRAPRRPLRNARDHRPRRVGARDRRRRLDDSDPPSALSRVLAFVITAGLAWAMFMFGIDTMRSGLEQLVARGDARGVVETVAFLPFVLVAGIMMLAGAVSVAIAHPQSVLPAVGSRIARRRRHPVLRHERADLAALRTPWRSVLPWAVPAVALPLVVGIAALVMPAIWSVAAMAATVLAIVVLSEVRARHRTDAPA